MNCLSSPTLWNWCATEPSKVSHRKRTPRKEFIRWGTWRGGKGGKWWKQTCCFTIFAFRVFSFSVRVCLFAALRERYFPLRIWLAIRHSVEQPRAPCLAWMSSECCSAREVVHLALHCRRWCAASTAHVREELNGKMREIISVRRMSFMGTKMRVTKRMFLSNTCSSFEIEKDAQVEHD